MIYVDPPVVTVSNDLIQTQLEQNVTLECSVLSRPLARIYWEKNGKIIDENRMMNTRVNQTMSINRLQIPV
jgi:hypothetical protein